MQVHTRHSVSMKKLQKFRSPPRMAETRNLQTLPKDEVKFSAAATRSNAEKFESGGALRKLGSALALGVALVGAMGFAGTATAAEPVTQEVVVQKQDPYEEAGRRVRKFGLQLGKQGQQLGKELTKEGKELGKNLDEGTREIRENGAKVGREIGRRGKKLGKDVGKAATSFWKGLRGK